MTDYSVDNLLTPAFRAQLNTQLNAIGDLTDRLVAVDKQNTSGTVTLTTSSVYYQVLTPTGTIELVLPTFGSNGTLETCTTSFGTVLTS